MSDAWDAVWALKGLADMPAPDLVAEARALLAAATGPVGRCDASAHAALIASSPRLLDALCDEVERLKEEVRVGVLFYENEQAHAYNAAEDTVHLRAKHDGLLADRERLVKAAFRAGDNYSTSVRGVQMGALSTAQMQPNEAATVARLLGEDSPRGDSLGRKNREAFEARGLIPPSPALDTTRTGGAFCQKCGKHCDLFCINSTGRRAPYEHWCQDCTFLGQEASKTADEGLTTRCCSPGLYDHKTGEKA